MDTLTLGEQIGRAREAKKLSLRRLEQITGVSKSYLSLIERGTAVPSADVLWKTAEAVGLEPSSLIEQAMNEGNLLITFANVPAEKRKAVSEMVRAIWGPEGDPRNDNDDIRRAA